MGQYGLKQRGDTWYSNIVIPGSGGKLHVQALSSNLSEAKKMRDEIKVAMDARDPKKLALCPVKEMPVDIFSEKVLLNYQKKKPGTYRIVARALRKLVETLPIKTLGDITPDALEELRAQWVKTGHIKVDAAGNPTSKDNVAGANREIRALVTIMRWAEDNKEIKLPVQNWRPVIKGKWRETVSRKLFYSPEQHEKLQAHALAASPIMLRLYMLAYHAGLRRGEIRHLWKADIDLTQRGPDDWGRLLIREKTWTDAKTGELRHWAPKGSNVNGDMKRSVPIDKKLADYLHSEIGKIPGDWIMSESFAPPVHEDTLSDQWESVIHGTEKKPGVGVGSIHTLRHCFATDWLSRGEPLENVQRFLGHLDITTTQRIYNHFVPTKFATVGSR